MNEIPTFLQKYMFAAGWSGLRPFQQDAWNAIYGTSNSCLIVAGTASGKTEAALFPALAELKPGDGIQAVIICPFKALLEDQVLRYSQYVKHSDLRVSAWHGDVTATDKIRFLKNPTEVLLITPESLDSLLTRKTLDNSVFSQLRFFIVDEIHLLIGQDRGVQTALCCNRLSKISEKSLRVVAMSATVSSTDDIVNFISTMVESDVSVISSSSNQRHWGNFVDVVDWNRQIELIHSASIRYKTLVFVQSRQLADTVSKALLDRFHTQAFLYYSTLTPQQKATTLETFRHESCGVVIATSALEVGIDISDVSMVIQLGAAGSISSFVQRIGRCGRNGYSGKFMLLFPKPTQKHLKLDWNFVYSLAQLDLYFRTGYIEDVPQNSCVYSALIHQIFCELYDKSVTVGALFLRLISYRALASVSFDEYSDIIRHLCDNDYLYLDRKSTLILTDKGFDHVRSLTFFSMFFASSGYKVFYNSRELGTVDSSVKVGDIISLQGLWRITAIDSQSGRAIVEHGAGKPTNLSKFRSIVIDRRVHETMLDLDAYSVVLNLSAAARAYLLDNIELLHRLPSNYHILVGKKGFSLGIWKGTSVIHTLKEVFANTLENGSVKCYRCGLRFSGISVHEFLRQGMDLTYRDFRMALVGVSGYTRGRYDALLPKHLKSVEYIVDELNVDAAFEVYLELKDYVSSDRLEIVSDTSDSEFESESEDDEENDEDFE